ncbi:hypothetical protein [Segetibacter aerophilus]|uniref:Uncharacterized protein n=1 Tax=Segetibacter aerophilus TaxID=670293 RepID=A0A512BHM4_9BACT|nr:hypothetical protein [Segetibacter aerophilus]GEO11471.1 hypothetical protein SAE01_39670 [Segetibacter aerophilus]
MLKAFVKAKAQDFGKTKTSYLRLLQILDALGNLEEYNVIKSIITTKAFTKVIASANSANEIAAGTYG